MDRDASTKIDKFTDWRFGKRSIMRHWLQAFSLLFCAMFSTSTLAEHLLIVGADDYFGVCYVQSGHPAGVFPMLLKEIARISGDEYELQLHPWKVSQTLAASGQAGIAHFSWTTERARIFDFSDPVMTDDIQLWVKKDHKFSYRSPRDLIGHRVGAKNGASFGQALDDLMSSGQISVERDEGFQDRIRKLLLGRIDVAIVEGVYDRGPGSSEGDNGLQTITVLPAPLVQDPLYLAFPKSMHRQAALQRFNKALAQLKKTARYRELTVHP